MHNTYLIRNERTGKRKIFVSIKFSYSTSTLVELNELNNHKVNNIRWKWKNPVCEIK